MRDGGRKTDDESYCSIGAWRFRVELMRRWVAVRSPSLA